MEKARFGADFFVIRAARPAVTRRNDTGDNFCHFMTPVGTKVQATVLVHYVRPEM